MGKDVTCYCLVKYGQAPPGMAPYICFQEKCANWRANEAKKESDIMEETPFVDQLKLVVQVIEEGHISGKLARTWVAEMIKSKEEPEAVFNRLGLQQLPDPHPNRPILKWPPR